MNQLAEPIPAATDQKDSSVPRKVFLFSGHMIDAPDRSKPRFPEEKEPIAVLAMGVLLDQLLANPDDVAISSAACGGDLIFAEACLQRGVRMQIYLPFVEEEFLKKSVDFAGEHWRQRFFAVKERVQDWHIMPYELPPASAKEDPFSRVNLWMLGHAVAYGARKIRFICLWDRRAGDGAGGTKHLHDAVIGGEGKAYVLDTKTMW